MFESGVLEHLSSQDDSSRHPSRRLFWLEVVSGYVESNSRLLPEEVSSDGVGLSTPSRETRQRGCWRSGSC